MAAGTPAMTSRGLKEADMEVVADLLQEALLMCKEVQESHGKLLKEFVKGLDDNPKVADLRARVEQFASAFPMPGFDISNLS